MGGDLLFGVVWIDHYPAASSRLQHTALFLTLCLCLQHCDNQPCAYDLILQYFLRQSPVVSALWKVVPSKPLPATAHCCFLTVDTKTPG